MLGKDTILAADIGSSGIKLAEFKPLADGGLELVNFAVGSLELDPHNDSDRSAYIVTTLRELLREKGIKSGKALVSVPGQSVFSRFVKLPTVDKDKVYQIIYYEAQQNVPFPIDEVVWDYQLIGGDEGELNVMLVAIKAEIIEGLTDCVEAASLDPDLVDVAPMAIYNAVRYNYADLEGCTLVVDIGARSTDLIFLENNRIFSRSIPVAGNTVTQQIMREFELSFADAEEMKRAHAFCSFGGAYEGPASETADRVSKTVRNVMTRMHAEINRSINFYRSQQGGAKPTRILLTGGSSTIPYTDVFLKEKLKVEVDYLNPFRNVAVHEAIPTEDIAENANLLAEVVGLALRRVLSCPIEINLMPLRVLSEKAFRRKTPFFVASLIGAALTIFIWCVFFSRMTQIRQTKLSHVQAERRKLEAVEQRLQESENAVEAELTMLNRLSALSGKRTIWLKLLDEIHAALPEGMWLTKVEALPVLGTTTDATSTKIADRIEISGYAYKDKVPTARPIIEFRDILRSSTYFKENDETQIVRQPSPGPDDYVREYRIQVALETPIEL